MTNDQSHITGVLECKMKVFDDTHLMSEPETVEGFLSDGRVGENVYDRAYSVEQEAGGACHCTKQPERHVGLVLGARGEVELGHQAHQPLHGLGDHVVKVEDVAHTVSHGEESRSAGTYLQFQIENKYTTNPP